MMRNLNNNMRRLDKRQMQYATGKRIHRPSDDPIAVSRSIQVRSDIRQLEQHKRNADDALSWLETTEQAIIDTNEAMHRLRELTVQASNGVLTKEETIKIQKEIEEIKGQMIQLGNTTYGGKYIFSGKNTDTPLFSQNGSYNMDLFDVSDQNLIDHRIQYQVGTAEFADVNTIGIDVFESYDNASDLTMDFPTEVDGTTVWRLHGAEVEITMEEEGPPPTFTVEGGVTAFVDGKEELFPLSIGVGMEKDEVAEAIAKELNEIIHGDADEGVEAQIKDPFHPLKNLTFEGKELKTKQETTEEAWIVKAAPEKAGVIHLIEDIEYHMQHGNHEELSNKLEQIDTYMDSILVARAEIGAKVNRINLVQNRIQDNIINFKELQSNLEDADMAEVTMELMNEENVYQASLAVGARIIQPTLLDFLR